MTRAENSAEWEANHLRGEPLAMALYSLIFPLWSKYDRVIYACEACGRLWLEMDGNRFVSYLQETDTRAVIWSRHNHNPYGYRDE